MPTVRNYIVQAMNILAFQGDDPVRLPGAYERLQDALVELSNSREYTEKVTTRIPNDEGRHEFIKVTNHKARIVLDD